jgi:D-glycero-alpha-D-manno-heptose-7-phosphate kinase
MLPEADLARIYRSLRLIRRAEEETARIYPSDKIKSPVHLAIGQEAVATGICDPLAQDDVVAPTYRSHALYLAKGGGLNRINFNTDGTRAVLPVIIPPARRQALESSLMLFFTGFSRFASEVAKKQIENFAAREAHLKSLGQTVEEGLAILQDERRSLDELGRLLHEGWRIKRELADGVTTPAIDEIYSAGREAGAIGGKLLGAGGGGFMLFYVPPEKRTAVRERLRNLIHVGFRIEGEGSKIVLYEPNGL